MQTSPVTSRASVTASASGVRPPAADQTTAAAELPPAVLSSRIGHGSVRSEIDRSIRLRIDGTGAPSSRELVPDSAAARALFAAGHGQALTTAVRGLLGAADAVGGHDNLQSITLLPDEHSAKAVTLLNSYLAMSPIKLMHLDSALHPDKEILKKVREVEPPNTPDSVTERSARRLLAGELVNTWTKDVPAEVSFSAAVNRGGNITIMPDVSRDLLTSIGLYRVQPGDETAVREPRPQLRRPAANYAWHTAIHEIQHSLSPETRNSRSEWANVMEESVAEVVAPMLVPAAMHAGGANTDLLTRPARRTTSEPVSWAPWNRQRLPAPDAGLESTAGARYVSGPDLLRGLITRAGIDRRTTSGREQAIALLQGDTADRVPLRLARAIATHHSLGEDVAQQLAGLVKQAATGKATLHQIDVVVQTAASAQ